MPRPKPTPLAQAVPHRDGAPIPQHSLAGDKLRAWRCRENLRAADAARRLGVAKGTIYRIETEHRNWGSEVIRVLVEAGICAAGDFWLPGNPRRNLRELCSQCERKLADPVTEGCTQVSCPKQRAVAA